MLANLLLTLCYREVEVVSSDSVAVGDHHTTVKGGIRVGMSQLVANIMETCQQLCNLTVPPELVRRTSHLTKNYYCLKIYIIGRILVQ